MMRAMQETLTFFFFFFLANVMGQTIEMGFDGYDYMHVCKINHSVLEFLPQIFVC